MSGTALPFPGRSRLERDDPLLTAAEVAARWRVNVETVRRLSRRGELPVLKIGARRRFRLSDVEQYEENHLQGGSK